MTLAILLEVYSLKDLPRAGWLRVQIDSPESVASHSWGMAWLGMMLCPAALNKQRVLELCLIHDLAETRTGDITPHDGISREVKRRKEAKAAELILDTEPALMGAWQEYEDHRTPESQFVHELDKLDMAIQALRYAQTRETDTREFIESAASGISHPSLRAMFNQVVERMQTAI